MAPYILICVFCLCYAIYSYLSTIDYKKKWEIYGKGTIVAVEEKFRRFESFKKNLCLDIQGSSKSATAADCKSASSGVVGSAPTSPTIIMLPQLSWQSAGLKNLASLVRPRQGAPGRRGRLANYEVESRLVYARFADDISELNIWCYSYGKVSR